MMFCLARKIIFQQNKKKTKNEKFLSVQLLLVDAISKFMWRNYSSIFFLLQFYIPFLLLTVFFYLFLFS